MATQRKSNRAQAQIDALYNQTLEIQKQVSQEYKNRGLSFDKATGKAVPTTSLGALDVPKTISSSNLNPTPAVTPLNIQPSTKGKSLMDELSSTAEEIYAKAQGEAQRLVPETTGLAGEVSQARLDYFNSLQGRKTRSELEGEKYNKEVDPAKKALDDIQGQIRSKALAYRRQIEDAQNNATGMTRAGVAGTVAEIERQGSRELADLSIIEQTKLQNYSTAKEIADRAISAELEGQERQLEAQKFWYTENKEQLTKEEDRRFQVMIGERERLLNQEFQTKQQISQIKLQAAQYGATGSDLAKIGQAKNFDEAIALSAQFLGKPFALQMQAQAFQESMQKSAMSAQVNESNQKALEAFQNTEEARNITVVEGQKNALDQVINDYTKKDINAVVGDPKALNDNDYTALSKDDSVVRSVATAEIRTANPETAKLADAGNTEALQDINARVAKWKQDNFGKGANIKRAIQTINSRYTSRLTAAQIKLAQYQQAYPDANILYTFYNGIQVPLNASTTPNYQGVILPK